MNPVLILTHNNLELTKRAVESVMKQDVPCNPFFMDNGSTDVTRTWITAITCRFVLDSHNAGVSFGWNEGLLRLFDQAAESVLVINNDVILPPWFYSDLLSYDLPFISGVSVDKMEQIAEKPPRSTDLQPHPDFSAFLIRRDCWEKVGPFDERMKHYASDLDFHIRAHRKGVRLLKANLPFYHERSSTLRLATPEERQEIEMQANKDRAVLREKWGVPDWGSNYDQMFREELFGIDADKPVTL